MFYTNVSEAKSSLCVLGNLASGALVDQADVERYSCGVRSRMRALTGAPIQAGGDWKWAKVISQIGRPAQSAVRSYNS